MQILENRERLIDIKKLRKQTFSWRTQKPETKGIKTKIKSKPIQRKNSIKSNISYPNLKKIEKNVPEPVSTI